MDINTLRLASGHLSNLVLPQYSNEVKADGLCIQSGKFGYISNSNFVSVSDQAELFQFTSHTFTSAGKTGPFGPTLAQLKQAYSVDWALDPFLFDCVDGKQFWTVPKTGVYEIRCVGGVADSFSFYSRSGLIRGLVELQKGDILTIVVGQSSSGFGGCGASFVAKDSIPLLIAGGSGGYSSYVPTQPGITASPSSGYHTQASSHVSQTALIVNGPNNYTGGCATGGGGWRYASISPQLNNEKGQMVVVPGSQPLSGTCVGGGCLARASNNPQVASSWYLNTQRSDSNPGAGGGFGGGGGGYVGVSPASNQWAFLLGGGGGYTGGMAKVHASGTTKPTSGGGAGSNFCNTEFVQLLENQVANTSPAKVVITIQIG